MLNVKQNRFLRGGSVLALGAAGSLLLTQGAAGNVFFSDDFSDGDRTVNPTWYLLHDTAGTSLTVVDDSAGIGSGNAMLLSIFGSGESQTRAAGANFAPVTLGSIGDSITLEFDARWTESTTNQDRRFSFGLYDAAGTPLFEDGVNSGASTDGHGYIVKADIGDPPSNMGLYQNRTGIRVFSTATAKDHLAAAGGDNTGVIDVARRYSLTITRTADTAEGDMADAQLMYQVDGVEIVSALLSDFADTALNPPFERVDTFGMLAIGVNDPTDLGNLLIDNVIVTSNIPEPASLALLGLGGLAMLGRRRA